MIDFPFHCLGRPLLFDPFFLFRHTRFDSILGIEDSIMNESEQLAHPFDCQSWPNGDRMRTHSIASARQDSPTPTDRPA